MRAMYGEHEKGFLEKLQSLDERTKQWILIAATAVIMIVVVYVWLAYFNSILANVASTTSEPAPALATPAAGAPGASGAASAGGTSVWQNIGNVFSAIYGSLAGAVRGLGSILQTPRQYIIHPPR